jgi:hypothetical protein
MTGAVVELAGRLGVDVPHVRTVHACALLLSTTHSASADLNAAACRYAQPLSANAVASKPYLTAAKRQRLCQDDYTILGHLRCDRRYLRCRELGAPGFSR